MSHWPTKVVGQTAWILKTIPDKADRLRRRGRGSNRQVVIPTAASKPAAALANRDLSAHSPNTIPKCDSGSAGASSCKQKSCIASTRQAESLSDV